MTKTAADLPLSPIIAAPARLRWGILSTGRIAGVFARSLTTTRLGRLVAIGSRSAENAARFASEHGLAPDRAHPSYEAILNDPEVEAIYLATPHPEHVEWAVRAAESGKHVLCEKPAGLNAPEAMVMIQAARRAGVVFMEAFMYRCHPQTALAARLVREGTIGRVRLLRASFGFSALPPSPTSRLWSHNLGGGGILDLGCYPVSFARLIAGATTGRPFADPIEVIGTGTLHPDLKVDEHASALLRFADGLVAQVTCSLTAQLDNSVRIDGEAGWIEIPHPWIVARSGPTLEIRLHRHGPGGVSTETFTTAADDPYALEADAFARTVRAGAREIPEMTPDDTLGNLRALDQWRTSLRLVYPQEFPEFSPRHTLARRPLAPRTRHTSLPTIPSLRIPGLAKPLSRLVMGCDNQRTYPHAAAMFDEYHERGGRAYDTAWLYGQGHMERLLGLWMAARGVRDEVVVGVKGGHPPYCTPRDVVRQLHESLRRLGTDYCDLYCLHRDNPDVPVGEFVDALAAEARAGRIRGLFGGSNWSTARVDEANAYARRHGLPGFALLSNQFSLARMVEAPWPGCLSASSPEDRAWLAARAADPQPVILFAWSSQARGFFTDRAAPDQRDDPEMVRTWYSEDNWQRRARALELAHERGLSGSAVAAAYVLAQPFPTAALIGPRTLAELEDSLECLRLTLTPHEVAWLDLRQETR